MLTFNYDSEKDLISGMKNGEVQKSIYDYIKESNFDKELYIDSSISLGPSITKENVLEHFDIEYAKEDKSYSYEDILNRKDNVASQFADIILCVYDRYQKDKERNMLDQECIITKGLPPLYTFQTLSRVMPFSKIEEGYYLDKIANYGFSFLEAEKIYNDLKPLLMKNTIVEDIVEARKQISESTEEIEQGKSR